MQKRVLLFGNGKSFMVNAIVRGLEKENYVIDSIGPDPEAVKALENKPKIYILYLE